MYVCKFGSRGREVAAEGIGCVASRRLGRGVLSRRFIVAAGVRYDNLSTVRHWQ
ncbi:MAG: hypothetical protein ACLQUT_07330 [Thermoleophilia bacterium]